jgi:hypothetical protein
MHIDLRKHNPPGVQEKKSAGFSRATAAKFSTKKSTGRIRVPVENMCGQDVGQGFSPDTERKRPTVCRHAEFTATAVHGGARQTLRTSRARDPGRLSFACVFEHGGRYRPHRGGD